MTKSEAAMVKRGEVSRLEAIADRVLAGSRRVAVKRAPRKQAERMDRQDAKAHRMATREVVSARSGGRCEACGATAGEALHWDHFHGRAREESVESTWMLCPRCDHRKTNNAPTRTYWLCIFRDHCEQLGYGAQVSKVDRHLALERAQHPEANP
jgi:5-methylcytosine-specific restriction endonuclease McrA